jgi:hypothetical protein
MRISRYPTNPHRDGGTPYLAIYPHITKNAADDSGGNSYLPAQFPEYDR